jgi:glycosyltransferase involved in cell wall biosynthesis
MRIAVVSPFLDRWHGTERAVVEQIERFLKTPGCEVHIYAQSVQDMEVIRYSRKLPGDGSGAHAIWHKIPTLPGPHLLNFVWWCFANQAVRWWDRFLHSVRFDVVFSPGINCSDADAIAVQIVFHEFFRLVRNELRLRGAPFRSWPVLLHRHLYYRVIMAMEKRVYRDPRVALAPVSDLTAQELKQHFGREDVTVIVNSVDLAHFNPDERLRRRTEARRAFGFSEGVFVALLVGNDWKKKGLPYLLQAVAALPDLPIRVLIVGRDDRKPFLDQMRDLRIESQVVFAQPSPDVMQFMAASDVYAGPSLHDSFAFPPLEAMACALPAITSKDNGGAQIITHGCDGFVLEDPRDSVALAEILRRLYEDSVLRHSIGEKAASTAKGLNWERNAREAWAFLAAAAKRKGSLDVAGTTRVSRRT